LVGEYSHESLPANPQSTALGMVKAGDFVYVASQENGLFVIDVSAPAQPNGSLLFPGADFTGLEIRDDSTLYISYDEHLSVANRGIHTVDISDPLNPQIVSSLDPLTVFDMLYEGSFLYV